jgi:hypothetical protein
MADEIKKVISVDLGNTSTSLKDYKKHIDQLRGSLLQLDETSEEYAKISKEIKTEQDKLNEVMKVGKINTDAAEGSYNQLAQTMAELKKQWKATADEAERANLGKQILDINNQLKELDASTGNYQRNVGDYTNAFEQAFDKCLDGITKLDGPIGELGGTVKNLIPVIKSINATAVAGLSGVKKAIASTGIGLLVIAVGELIAHWEDLTKIIGISSEDIQEFKTKAIDTFKNIVSGAVGVGNAILNFILTPIKTTIEAFKGWGSIIGDIFSGNWSQIKEDAVNTFNAIKDIGKKAISFRENYEQGREMADNMITVISERLKSPDNEEKAVESGKTIGKNINSGLEEELENTEQIIDSKTQSILDRLHKRNTDEIELLREKYEEEKALLEQYGLDTTQLTEEFEANVEAVIDKRLEEERKAIIEQEKLEDELTAKKKAESDKQLALKRKEQQALLSSSIALFGALSDLAEEGSEEQKAFSIMQTVLNTLQSIMGIWAGYSEMGPFGVAAAAVQTAAVVATGAATIAKMKSTTKETASSGASVSPPQISTPSMTTVNPLLDEQQDINRIEMSGIQGDSSKNMQNLRVYVVDQDIRDANYKASVVESNSTY